MVATSIKFLCFQPSSSTRHINGESNQIDQVYNNPSRVLRDIFYDGAYGDVIFLCFSAGFYLMFRYSTCYRILFIEFVTNQQQNLNNSREVCIQVLYQHKDTTIKQPHKTVNRFIWKNFALKNNVFLFLIIIFRLKSSSL